MLRPVIVNLFSQYIEVNIVPDEKHGVLRIRLHQLANKSEVEIVKHLCKELNETCTIFPSTNLRLFYEVVSAALP